MRPYSSEFTIKLIDIPNLIKLGGAKLLFCSSITPLNVIFLNARSITGRLA